MFWQMKILLDQSNLNPFSIDDCQPYQGDVDLVVCQINHYRPVPPFLNISACYYPLISADQMMVNSLPQGG